MRSGVSLCLVQVQLAARGCWVGALCAAAGEIRSRLCLHALLQHGEGRGRAGVSVGSGSSALACSSNFGALATCVRLVAGEENVSLPLIENMKNLVGQNEACPNPAWLPVLAWAARLTAWLVRNNPLQHRLSLALDFGTRHSHRGLLRTSRESDDCRCDKAGCSMCLAAC